MNPEKALTFQIRTLGNLIERKMNYIIAKNVHDDLTPMHSMILAYLHRNEGHDIYQKDIESRFDITRSTVTSILKLMEHKGYIRREGVAHDARLKKIVPTPLGKEIHCRVESSILQAEELVESAITPKEHEELLVLLKKLRDRIQEPME